MPTERERLVRDIDGLKESIRLAWMDMLSKPMTAAERGELRKSIDSLVKDLDNLRTKLDSYQRRRRSKAVPGRRCSVTRIYWAIVIGAKSKAMRPHVPELQPLDLKGWPIHKLKRILSHAARSVKIKSLIRARAHIKCQIQPTIFCWAILVLQTQGFHCYRMET